MMKTFEIHNREAIAWIDPPVEHLIISISDSDEARPPAIDVIEKNDQCRGVLRLSFHDADQEVVEGFPGKFHIMTEQDGDAVLDFVAEHSEVELIIVHCDGGHCRSPATAAALALIFNGKGRDQTFFDRFLPNRHVYRVILNAAVRRDLL